MGRDCHVPTSFAVPSSRTGLSYSDVLCKAFPHAAAACMPTCHCAWGNALHTWQLLQDLYILRPRQLALPNTSTADAIRTPASYGTTHEEDWPGEGVLLGWGRRGRADDWQPPCGWPVSFWQGPLLAPDRCCPPQPAWFGNLQGPMPGWQYHSATKAIAPDVYTICLHSSWVKLLASSCRLDTRC